MLVVLVAGGASAAERASAPASAMSLRSRAPAITVPSSVHAMSLRGRRPPRGPPDSTRASSSAPARAAGVGPLTAFGAPEDARGSRPGIRRPLPPAAEEKDAAPSSS